MRVNTRIKSGHDMKASWKLQLGEDICERIIWIAPYTTTLRLPSSPPLAREVYNSVLMVVGFCRRFPVRLFCFCRFYEHFVSSEWGGRAADPRGPKWLLRGCVERDAPSLNL